MVSLKRATTSCVVQKEKTQTRITFNNLSATLTVNDLYKYVQLHLEEDRPFELSLVRDSNGGGGGGGDVLEDGSSLKVSLADHKQKTLLAAGLSFENGAGNTVVLTSAPKQAEQPIQKSSSSSSNSNNNCHSNGFKTPIVLERAATMGVSYEMVDTTNGNATTNGKNGETPAEELNNFSRQITINTNLEDQDEDPAPLISPIECSPLPTVPEPPPLPALEYPSFSTGVRTLSPQSSAGPSTGPKFVGLVNQAMTCYLNSLLQALYMTPEFRNALYNWEFDGHDESKSIPYQLQRLFLNLQTSPKTAVETTDLTRSFGWDSSEAWQQHDIQELCRVMFDALEHKFKNTKESNLINRLYEGKMIDYLKCLSCNTEKQREDTFLDIPLPVKPFGSTVAFESIEEALRAFIQPEILNGNNQYSCETCQKKCDAHKGLKFSKFPYILTLHLKRFDFDYQTFHRIKLNDRVTFPQTLNLNGLVNTATDFPETNGDASDGPASKAQGDGAGATNGHPAPMDVGNGATGEEDSPPEAKPSASTFGSHSGPYLYELFAIMIHSGSASGGHYYVYIKDFDSGWFCFNDQCVSPITQEDIQKSFGGNAGRYQYSGAYTTSTNAYMLMYRQLDPAKNQSPTKLDDLPEHIQMLQKRLKDRPEMDTRRRTDSSVITTRVYHYDRERCKLSDVKIHISGDYYLDELLQRAYDRMSLATLRSLNLCRIVPFDSRTEQTLASVEHHDQTLLQDVLEKYSRCDFLLEERDRDAKFRTYSSPMLNARVYLVDLMTTDAEGPHRVAVQLSGTVADMKRELRQVLNIPCVDDLRVAVSKGNLAVILENDKDVLKHEIDPTEVCPVKLFVAIFPDAAKSRADQFDRRLKRIVERFDRIVTMYIKVPAITPESRKLNSIPDYVPIRDVEVVEEATKKECPVVVRVEAAIDEVPALLQVAEPDAKALSPSPEPTISSASESASPSPEPVAAEAIKVVKKKSLVPKSTKVEDSKSKEKSPVKIIETTKEVTENGVTRKVKVVRRIVKRDPAKKAAAAAAVVVTENGDSVNSEAPAKTSATKKVVKKVKLPGDSPKEESSVVKSVPLEKEVTPPVVAEALIEAVELITSEPIVDAFLYLDSTLDADSRLTASGKHYFRAIPKQKTISEQNGSIADDEMRLIQVQAEKSFTISALKECLEPILEVSKDYFKVNRSRTETLRLNELVSNFSDGDEFHIELGRILQDGECKYRISLIKLSSVTDYTEELEHLCDFIVRNNQRVDEVKHGILEYLSQTGNKSIGELAPEKYRLWSKVYYGLGQVYTDELVLGDDFYLRKNGEFALEEIEEGTEPMTDADELVVFIRKWNSDTLVLEPYQSLTLSHKSELVERLSERSGIPTESLEYARNMAPFPKMKISRLNINTEMDWKSEPLRTSSENLRSGHVYFYRDKTVPVNSPTTEEIMAIKKEEASKRDEAKGVSNGNGMNQNGDGGGGSVDSLMGTAGPPDTGSGSYTVANRNRRKEKALKIYLDSSPAKVTT